MKLITKEVAATLPALYSTEDQTDPICLVKLFHPMSSYTCYLTEYDPNTGLAFGYVVGAVEDELGYIHIAELEKVKICDVGMERDLYYKPEKLSVIKKRGS